jgi:hypothetical protein
MTLPLEPEVLQKLKLEHLEVDKRNLCLEAAVRQLIPSLLDSRR